MQPNYITPLRRGGARTAIVAATVLITMDALVACSSDGPSAITQPQIPAPAVEVFLDPKTVFVEQGQTTYDEVTVLRRNSFAGAVTLNVLGAPAGLTATLDPIVVPPGSVDAELTLAAAETTIPGTYAITVTAKGAGIVDHTAVLYVTVTAIPTEPIIVAFGNDWVWVVQGDTEVPLGTVTVRRAAGYSGPVYLTIEGLPAGVTARFDPQSLGPGATTSDLIVTAAANALTGIYAVTVRGAGIDVADGTTAFPFIVFPPAG